MREERGPLTTSLWRLAPWLIVAAVAWLVFLEPEADVLPDGSSSPALSSRLSDGQEFQLADARGQVVVLNFWATWCPACREETPALNQVHQELTQHGGRLVALSVEQATLPEVVRVARRLGMRYAIGMCDATCAARFGVRSLPTTYVVGPEGLIRSSAVGTIDAGELIDEVRRARRKAASDAPERADSERKRTRRQPP